MQASPLTNSPQQILAPQRPPIPLRPMFCCILRHVSSAYLMEGVLIVKFP